MRKLTYEDIILLFIYNKTAVYLLIFKLLFADNIKYYTFLCSKYIYGYDMRNFSCFLRLYSYNMY